MYNTAYAILIGRVLIGLIVLGLLLPEWVIVA